MNFTDDKNISPENGQSTLSDKLEKKTQSKVSRGTTSRRKARAKTKLASENKKLNRIRDIENGVIRLELRVYETNVPEIRRWLESHKYFPIPAGHRSLDDTALNAARPVLPDSVTTEPEESDRSLGTAACT